MANAKKPSAAKPKGNVSPSNMQKAKGGFPQKKAQMPAARSRPGGSKGAY